jgi:hypothetical protein
MSFTLNTLRQFKPLAVEAYPAEFVPLRVASTPDSKGSIYLYKRTKDDASTYQGIDRRHCIQSYVMTLAGSVTNIVQDVRCIRLLTMMLLTGL